MFFFNFIPFLSKKGEALAQAYVEMNLRVLQLALLNWEDSGFSEEKLKEKAETQPSA